MVALFWGAGGDVDRLLAVEQHEAEVGGYPWVPATEIRTLVDADAKTCSVASTLDTSWLCCPATRPLPTTSLGYSGDRRATRERRGVRSC